MDPLAQFMLLMAALVLIGVIATFGRGNKGGLNRSEPNRYHVTMYSGGKVVAEWTTARFQLGEDHISLDTDRIPQNTFVTGDYVLKQLPSGPPKPPTEPVQPRYLARLFNSGEVVAKLEVVSHYVGRGWVILVTPNQEQWVFGGNYVIEPIRATGTASVDEDA